MQKINDNRFEQFFINFRNYFKPIGYFIKIIGIVVVMLIILELCSLLAVNYYVSHTSDIRISKQKTLDSYRDKNWTEDYFIETKHVSSAEYYPYVGHRRTPNFNGDYYNINNESIRKTFNPCINNSVETFKIFVFGGSTIWGTGARDHETIPSHLSKYLCEKGYNVEVINFGEGGYTNSQEMIKLQLELRNGNIPEVVIFYDGVNDVYSSYQNGVAGLPQNIGNRQREFNSMYRYQITGILPNFFKILRRLSGNSDSDKFVKFSNESLNLETSKIYLSNIRIINSLQREFGFETFFYWQPSVSTKLHLSEFEEEISYDEKILYKDYNMVSDIVKKSDDVISLTDIFDHTEETIFIDWVHIHEQGNSIVARRISNDIFKYLKELGVV